MIYLHENHKIQTNVGKLIPYKIYQSHGSYGIYKPTFFANIQHQEVTILNPSKKKTRIAETKRFFNDKPLEASKMRFMDDP